MQAEPAKCSATGIAVSRVFSVVGANFRVAFTLVCIAVAPVFAQDSGVYSEILSDLNLEGTVQAGEKAFVANSINGTLIAIHFEPGDFVEEGDLLFELSPIAFQQSLEASEAIVARREAELNIARRRADRVSELRERGTVPEADAQEVLDSLVIARASLAEAEAQRNLAAIQLSATQIKSPISGLIGQSRFQIGTYLKLETGQALAQVTRLDPVLISYSQPYDSLVQLASTLPGRLVDLWPRFQVTVLLPTGEKLQEVGRLRYFDNELQSDGSLNVWAEVPNPSGLLVPGLTVQLEISLSE